jgi:hypothetical protein
MANGRTILRVVRNSCLRTTLEDLFGDEQAKGLRASIRQSYKPDWRAFNPSSRANNYIVINCNREQHCPTIYCRQESRLPRPVNIKPYFGSSSNVNYDDL